MITSTDHLNEINYSQIPQEHSVTPQWLKNRWFDSFIECMMDYFLFLEIWKPTEDLLVGV